MPTKVFDAFTRLDASDENAYLANKSISNAIINGAMEIWQRGTSVTHSADPNPGQGYTADRFQIANVRDGVAWRSITVSRSTNAPVGFQYSAKVTTGANDVNRVQFQQTGEGWDLLIGKPATFSFYIRRLATTDTSTALSIGIGGVGSELWGSFNTLSTTEFTRITRTFTAETSLTGVSISLNTSAITTPILATAGDLFEITGVQLEAGTVANDFRRNANSLQGELAACQRYYYRFNAATVGDYLGFGAGISETVVLATIFLPVSLRTQATSIDFSSLRVFDGVSAATSVSTASISNPNLNSASITLTSSGIVTHRPYWIIANTLPSFIGISAEL
jgi:hypothetical protein